MSANLGDDESADSGELIGYPPRWTEIGKHLEDPLLGELTSLGNGYWAVGSNAAIRIDETQDGAIHIDLTKSAESDPSVLVFSYGVAMSLDPASRPEPEQVSLPPCKVTTDASLLEVYVLSQDQSLGEITELLIEGEYERVLFYTQVWPGDPGELGTVIVSSLSVRYSKEVLLAGDDLVVENLDAPTFRSTGRFMDEWKPDSLTICKESTVHLAGSRYWPALSLQDKARLHIYSAADIRLGQVGENTELHAEVDRISVDEWSFGELKAESSIHLLGIRPLNEPIVRQFLQRGENGLHTTLASYEPRHADEGLDVSDTFSASSEAAWVDRHLRLVNAVSRRPDVRADAKWLSYEKRRLTADRLSFEWLVLTALGHLGYGLKPVPPARAWIASISIVVLCHWLFGPSTISFSNPLSAIWRGLRLWIEALLLPTGLFSFGADSGNATLTLDGAGLKLARLVTAVPLGSLLLALKTRYRLPSLSGTAT